PSRSPLPSFSCPPRLSFSISPRPPCSPLFPYTTLFRSVPASAPRPPSWRQPRSPSSACRIRHPCDGSGPDHHRSRSRRSFLPWRSEEHTSELQSRENLVCRLLLEKKNTLPPAMSGLPPG